MNRKFIIAMSLAAILAAALTSLALAEVLPAHIVFTTDLACPVTVLVSSYTDPILGPYQTASGSTPWILDTVPDTSIMFFYPASVVCNGVTYNFQSASPASPIPDNATPPDSTTTVIGHYLPPVPDTTPPVITVPEDMTVEATSLAGAVVNFSASAVDDVDGPLTPTCTSASGSTFPFGPTLVTCSATDTAGNSAEESFTITVQDTTPPAITVPADIIAEATSPAGAVVSFSASATDLVDGIITPVCTPASGSTFPLGTTPVNCTATDTHGNESSASFNVTVVDTAPPVLTLPANMTVTALNTTGAPVSFTATANDLVDGPVPVTCSPVSGWFPIGQTTVNCWASDSDGNIGSGSFTVAVQYAMAAVKCGGIPGHQILQPINTDGSSIFKQGSTIPIKFRVCGMDGNSVGTSGVITSFGLANGDKPISTTSDTSFRFGNQQWIFNLSTKNLTAGNTYVYYITLNDGSTIQFEFSLK